MNEEKQNVQPPLFVNPIIRSESKQNTTNPAAQKFNKYRTYVVVGIFALFGIAIAASLLRAVWRLI